LIFENISSHELHHVLDDRWKAIRFLLQEESAHSKYEQKNVPKYGQIILGLG